MTTNHPDRMHQIVDDAMQSCAPYRIKLLWLALLEPMIAVEYAKGNTSVKPVAVMTVSDIWPI